MTSNWPPIWKANDIVFAAVTDDLFIKPSIDFIEALQHLGYNSDDIMITCVTKSCSDTLSKEGVESFLYVSDIEHRFLICEAKIAAIIHVLKSGRSIFFLDLDAFIKGDPLSFIPSLKDNMIAQYNTDTEINFGVFLVRPNDKTIDLFECMLQRYKETRAPDQNIFGDLVMREKNLTYSIFDKNQYINHMHGFDPKNKPIIVHMTCVEGFWGKRYLANLLYGDFNNPKAYHEKTLSAYYDYNNMTYAHTAFFIDKMVSLSKTFNRAIRIISDHTNILSSIFSAEKLFKHNIRIVEPTYWESYKKFNLKSDVSRKTVNVIRLDHNHTLLRNNITTADDIFVQFPNHYWVHLQNKSHVGIVPNLFLCNMYIHNEGFKGTACLSYCDGIHWFGK